MQRRPPAPRLALGLLLLAVLVGVGGVVLVSRRVEVIRPLRAQAAAGDPGAADLVLDELRLRLASLRPEGPFAVVDSYANRLRVQVGEEIRREAVCSTGTGAVLRDPRSGRLWVFDTPLGEHRVQKKVREPVWVKPDWAFIEEGLEPPRDAAARLDELSLGPYGLYLGQGIIIHGTLFQTLLGQRATHGCIRLGNEDLEYVYRQLPVGARVFVY